MKNNWQEILKAKSEDYSEPAPEGLWDDIGSSLQRIVRKRRRTRRSAAALFFCSAAAAAAIIIALKPGKNIPESGNDARRPMLAAARQAAAPETLSPAAYQSPASVSASLTTSSPARARSTAPASSTSTASAQASSAAPAAADAPASAAAPAPLSNQASATAPSSVPSDAMSYVPGEVPGKDAETYAEAFPETNPEAYSDEKRHRGRIAVNISASGMGASSSNASGYSLMMASGAGMATPSSMTFGGESLANLLMSNNDRQINSRTVYSQPVKVGMTVLWQFSEKLGLESGLNYSLLVSDITSGTDDNKYLSIQSLHYLGVPLNLVFYFWNQGGMSAFATAGGLVQKCVYGQTTEKFNVGSTYGKGMTSDAGEHQLQWSINAGLGIQYRIAPEVSIFAGPDVYYYFENGSAVDNIYKQRKFNFDFSLGFRFSL